MNSIVYHDSQTVAGNINNAFLSLYHQTRAFAHLGYESTMFSYYNSNSAYLDSISAFKTDNNLKIENIGRKPFFLRYFYKSAFSNKLIKRINRINPDVFYVRNVFFIPIIKKFKKPFIFEIHSIEFYSKLKIVDFLLKHYFIISAKSKLCIKVVAISQNLKKKLISFGIPEHKTEVLYNGFNHTNFLKKVNNSQAKKQISYNTSAPLVIYTGSLYEVRGVDVIIDLANEYSEVNFKVIGGPDFIAKKYTEISNERGLNNIEFLGFIKHEKIPQYLFAADILLAIFSKNIPTIDYCSPLKIPEYMASGNTVVASGFITIKEVLEGYKNCFLTDDDSFENLCHTLDKALQFTRKNNVDESARNFALQHFNWDLRARKIIDTIK